MTDLPQAADLTPEHQVQLLSGQDFWHSQGLPGSGVPSLVLTDGPHGVRLQQGDADNLGLGQSLPSTCFPPAVTLASTWDDDLVGEVGAAIAAEAKALGVHVMLGPGLNIKRHPLCGRNFEYFSEDPLLAGRLAAAYVSRMQAAGVAACPKHFAVNNQEGHRFVVDAVVDERTLREIYLSGFEHVVKTAQPWTIMASYNLVNGQGATVNRRLLTSILRQEWAFDGLVMSDWGATRDRADGVLAGMDLEMPGSGGLSDDAVLRRMPRDGRLRAAVTASAQRVLELTERVIRDGGNGAAKDSCDSGQGGLDDLREEHDALARRVAAAGTVLLQNDGLLPIAPQTSIALVGAFAEQPRYQGAGSSRVNPTRLTLARQALQDKGFEVTYAPGYDPVTSAEDPALIDAAAAIAARSDVAVVLVGLPDRYESEGFDRADLRLPPQHDALVAAVAAVNPRTVVALSNGSPVLMPWRGQVAAVLETYLGGQAGGGALADVLVGDAEPAGRLAETFPATLSDVASDAFFPGQPHQVEYREGLFVGYRHATTAGLKPLFPFGHGLGYATTAWSEAALDRAEISAGEGVRVSVTVTSTGERSGSDVVQVYLHDRTEVVLRPRRELAAYAKVHLEPGETRRLEIEVPARAFAFWDTDTQGWSVPRGRYAVELARSSADVVATLAVQVTAGVSTAPEPAGTEPVAGGDAAFRARLRRPVPVPRAVRPFTRESTLGELSSTQVGRVLRARMRRQMASGGAADEAERLMTERSLDEFPLRAVAMFSQGRLRWSVVDAALGLANRQPGPALTGALSELRVLLPALPRAALGRLGRTRRRR